MNELTQVLIHIFLCFLWVAVGCPLIWRFSIRLGQLIGRRFF
ncbi:hypothetical protein VQ7734_04556 [Vibrio quintilis]|uniref:Uncharacterized protein n=1 Tax=Vibrio quintilis TaxID=1117707 RepID=A0A1M7Z1S2_9VIBR|nr:hypothetical protein [Vibrio quintilis]SHO58784.1 hypothetical protein VQ7734_04556 [Vibrio quintilis]